MAPNGTDHLFTSATPSQSWLSPPPVAPHLPDHPSHNSGIGEEEDDIVTVPLAQQYPQFSRDRLLVESSDEDELYAAKYSKTSNTPKNIRAVASSGAIGATVHSNNNSNPHHSAPASASTHAGPDAAKRLSHHSHHSSTGSGFSGFNSNYRRSSNHTHQSRSSTATAPLSTRQIREFSSFGFAPPGSNLPNKYRDGITASNTSGYTSANYNEKPLETVHVRGMGRRKSYNVNRHSITNAAYYCVSSSVYLCLVFGLEMKAPGELIFSSQDIWRYPFFYAAIISWALLIFGFFIQCTILGIGRTRNEQIGRRKSYMISLAPNARIPVVIALFWVSAGLITSGIASIFVFMGLKNRAEAIPAVRNDPFHRYVLPIIGGILSALINAIMALACFIAAMRALTSLKAPSSKRSKKSKDTKSRDETAIPINDGSFGSAHPPAGHYESWGSLNNQQHSRNNSRNNSNNIYVPPSTVPPTAPPRVSSEKIENLPQLSRAEIDKRLGQLQEMGFPNEQQNYEALYASSFVVSVAAQRLTDSHI